MNFLQNKSIDFYSPLLLHLSNTEYNGQWIGRIIAWILSQTYSWNDETEFLRHKEGKPKIWDQTNKSLSYSSTTCLIFDSG